MAGFVGIRSAENGKDFASSLEKSGWTLARGDRRDFVVIDPKGGTHSLARRIEGVKLKDVRARMAGVDMGKLPSVAEARATVRARLATERTRGAAPSKRPAKQPPIRVIGGIARGARVAAGPAGGALKAAGKVLEGVASVFEGLLGGGPSAPAKNAKDYEKLPLDTGGGGKPSPEIEEASHHEQEQKAAKRQRYLKDFSREVPDEQQPAADMERDRKGRERQRGE